MSDSPSTQALPRDGVIDLALGHPSPALLPLEILRRAAGGRLSGSDASLLQYGYEQGDGRFRRLLAEFLNGLYGDSVEPGELFVSNGVSQALDLICTLFTQPGDRVFVEEPTYFLALRIFADHGLRVTGLPTDANGLVPETLERQLAAERPVMLYTVPTYQNPGGTTMPEQRRRKLVELAREHGFLLVADEVYHPLSYRVPPPRALGSLAAGGNVLSLGSFSKILAPGLRLGWVQGAPRLLRRLAGCGLLDSGGGLSPFTAAIVGSALEQGTIQEHLSALRREYGARGRTLSRALRALVPSDVRFDEPDGGFFLWLELPDTRDSDTLLSRAVAAGVSFVPGRRFSSRRGFGNCLRLSFSYYGQETLAEAAQRLASVL